jgi:glycosyltransferase involved in cell wall biosynthesis
MAAAGNAGRDALCKGRRILMLVENLPVPFDRRVWQEATALRAAGHAVSIICPTGKGFEKTAEVIDGIHILRYRLPFEAVGAKGYLVEYPVALLCTFALSLRVLCTHGFDAIHACNPPDLFFLIGGFYKVCMRKKFVFDHHDISPELYEAKFGRRGFLYRMLCRFERWTFRIADMSIATNESYRRIAIERGGMEEARVHVVRSGPALDRWRMLPPRAKHRRGRDYLVGYLGIMGQQEGIDHLLRAASCIVRDDRRNDVHFVLVGDGPILPAMRDMARDLGIADHVTFTGRLPDHELLEILNTADVCVNPDLANEMNDKSTMNKVMEYMALGKPVVQFDLAEGRFSAREASLYARRNDAADLARCILILLDDPVMRARMGAYGRHRVEHELAWRHEAPKLLHAYEGLFAP